MNLQGSESPIFDHSSKHRKPKSREVRSRFLQSPANSSPSSFENVMQIQSPSHNNVGNLSPLRQKPKSSSSSSSSVVADNTSTTRKPKSHEKSGFIRGLWPSASQTSSSSSSSNSSKLVRDTLADHLGNERLMDLAHHKNTEKPTSMLLTRQTSVSESSRFENEKEIIVKENHKPLFGASMRYTGKFRFPGKSSSSPLSSKSKLSPKLLDDHENNNIILTPGRLSVDETALRKRLSAGRKSDYLADAAVDSESDNSATSIGSPVIGKSFPASYMAPTVSSMKSGNSTQEGSSSSHRIRRWSAESSPLYKRATGTADQSPKKNSSMKSMNRSNSLITNNNNNPVNESSRWRSSPGRPTSPTSIEDNKQGKTLPASTLKPPKVVGNLLSIGLELLKGKKSSSGGGGGTSPRGLGVGENVHQLRLLHNRFAQWRYTNAKADAVQGNTVKQVESNLTKAIGSLTKLQNSVQLKRLQLQKEKSEMKLNHIIHSQIELLEEWCDTERQHLSAVNMTKDCLNSVVCSVPLIEGAKVDPRVIGIALQDASDLTASVKLLLSDFPPMAEQNAAAFSELAGLVSQEKLCLQECLELFKYVSTLEVQEMSLKSNVMQLKLKSEKQNQPYQEHLEILI